MADANLSIGIESSQAERDAKKIIDALEDVQDAADKLSDGADFHIDTSEIDAEAKKVKDTLKDVEKEVDRLSGEEVNIKIDTQGAREAERAIDNIVNKIKDAGIPINLDTDGLAQEAQEIVREIKEEIDRNLERGIDVETSLKVITDAAEAEINRVMQEAERDEINIKVDADTSKAEQDINNVKESIADIQEDGDGLNFTIEVDTDSAVKDADELKEKIQEVNMIIEELADGSKNIRYVPVVDGASEALGEVAKDADNAAKATKKAGKEFDDAADEAKKLEAAVDKLGDAFKSATREMEFAEILGEGILMIAEYIGTAIIEFESFEDAVRAATGSSAAAAEAMEMLEEFARDTAYSIEDVTGAFSELRTNGLEASKAALTAYGNTAAGLNLTLTEMGEAVGDAAQRNFTKLNETQLKAKESGDKVIFTYMGMKTEVANTSAAIAGFIKNMGNTEFAGMMDEQASGFTAAMERMHGAMQEFSNDIGEGGLTEGLEAFSRSMVAVVEKGEDLASMLGGWLGAEIEGIGNFIETTVDEFNKLIKAIKETWELISNLPVISQTLDAAKGFAETYMPNLFVKDRPQAEGPAPAAVPGRTAFGSDTESERKTKQSKTPEQRQEENYEKQFASNDYMLRTLSHMDDAYDRGRESIIGWRNALKEASDRMSLATSVGDRNVESIMDQRIAMEDLKEKLAVKEEVMDQQEAIQQTLDLAVAQKRGSEAVQEVQASIEGYNAAVASGWSLTPELIAQFTELAWEAAEAKENLKFEESMTGFDRQIEDAAKLATAFREGGPAIREAALEQAVYNEAVSLGKENSQAEIDRIREKMVALRDLQDVQQSDQRNLDFTLNIEQMEREIGLSRLMGEQRFIEAARIEMLMEKKRRLKDVTAELNDEELKQADTLGKTAYAASRSGNALLELAERYGDINAQFQSVAMGGAMALEDSLVDIFTGAKSAKDAIADFASSLAEQMMRAAIQMAIIRPLLMGLGGFSFADGGVMTGSGPMSLPSYAKGGVMSKFGNVPLKSYSGGGIANSPQLALFGEGKMPEAYVPLPDGRRIPVKMEGGGGGGTAVSMVNNISVNMPQNATKEQGEQFGDAIARQVEDAMNENLMKQQKPGGLLDPYGYG